MSVKCSGCGYYEDECVCESEDMTYENSLMFPTEQHAELAVEMLKHSGAENVSRSKRMVFITYNGKDEDYYSNMMEPLTVVDLETVRRMLKNAESD